MAAASSFSGTLFIHVGPHKTGTTTIQRYLSENRQFVMANGLLYPECGRSPHAPEQHWAFGQAVLVRDSDYLDRFVSDLDRELSASAATRALLSTEVLSRAHVSKEMLQQIPRLFPRAKRVWIMLLRRQDKLLGSLYSEHLKKGLLAFPLSESHIAGPEFLDHLRRLQMLADASEDEV